ncbi:DUF6884 domain-containing protein [Saccharopolyspora hattusasensis]|uniref:DUF6884 domain-containing protein n=1 Tax=Saccharopolyspora hattusasensis TaxID=1128679 RepID=UPI003D962908
MTRLLVVPCGRAKLNHPAAARLLYRSAHFRFVLAGVERAAVGAPVRILSALHGLVSPDTVLAPYDVTMGDSGSVVADRLAAQLAAEHAREVVAYLPRAYLARLAEAAALTGECVVRDAYDGCRGIGEQRAVITRLNARK